MHIFGSIFLSAVLLFSFNATSAQVKQPVKNKTVKARATASPKAAVKPDTLVVAAPVKPANIRIRITTDLGEIVIKLSDKTPLHRDNFVKLVNAHFYDSLLFHRIIAGFMIQGGDPESKNAATGILLGKGGVGYTIPAEIDSTLYHKKGALAAARSDNPQKASSGCQFYLVHGKKYTDEELDMISLQRGIYFSPAKRMTYKMVGGTPLLDMNYTVFGDVETGLEVIDRIALSEKNDFNRPLKDIHMKMEVVP